MIIIIIIYIYIHTDCMYPKSTLPKCPHLDLAGRRTMPIKDVCLG